MRCGPRILCVSKVAAKVGATANRYQVLSKLAVGGMAEIFLVRSTTITGVERYCVLKRILPEHAGDASFLQMFVDEARLATQLQHPNIASVYDIGMLEDLYFYTMEYVHGETVRSLVERAQNDGRELPLACILTIIAGAAAGLHHAHVRTANDGRPLGIVHRDVSPSNLMVSYEGNVKLVDFGVAKASDRAEKTKSGTVKGKIYYLSPEQCRGGRVDRRSDLFSLGIVMWEMLTGARLYRRATDFESMAAIVTEAPPPPSSLRADIPRVVDAIVLRLLAKSVADRFQTAAEVVEAIENASIHGGTTVSTAAVGRLIHDLFGPRAEPWHELERERLSGESLALIAQPAPNKLPVALISAAPHASGGELARSVNVPIVGGTRDADPMTLSIEVSRSVSGLAPAALALLGVPPPSEYEAAREVPPAIEGTPAPSPSPLAVARRADAWPAYFAVAPTPGSAHPGPGPLGARPRASASRAVRLVVAATTIGVGISGLSHCLPSKAIHETRIAAVEQESGPPAGSAPSVADSTLETDRSAARGEQGQGASEPVRDREGSAVQTPRPVEPALATDHAGTPIPVPGSAPAEPVPQGGGAPREPERPQSAAATAVRHELRGRDSIAVAIDSDPPGAQVILGGRVLGTTPFHGELARQAHDVTFVIRLAAYAERAIVAHPSQAISVRVRLVRDGTVKPAKPDPNRIVNPFD